MFFDDLSSSSVALAYSAPSATLAYSKQSAPSEASADTSEIFFVMSEYAYPQTGPDRLILAGGFAQIIYNFA